MASRRCFSHEMFRKFSSLKHVRNSLYLKELSIYINALALSTQMSYPIRIEIKKDSFTVKDIGQSSLENNETLGSCFFFMKNKKKACFSLTLVVMEATET